MKKINLLGQSSGKLTVIKEAGVNKYRQALWLCRCECGNEIEIVSQRIKQNISKHCGCGSSGENSFTWTGHKEITGSFFATIKSGAKRRKLDFKITIEYIWDLFLKQNRKCALSGVDIVFAKSWNYGKNKEGTASLDRIDSTKGYIEGNVQWIHKDLQSMKWNKSDKIFIEWCKLIARRNDGQK